MVQVHLEVTMVWYYKIYGLYMKQILLVELQSDEGADKGLLLIGPLSLSDLFGRRHEASDWTLPA